MTFGSLSLMAVEIFGMDGKSVLISATFGAIMTSSILIAEGENRERKR